MNMQFQPVLSSSKSVSVVIQNQGGVVTGAFEYTKNGKVVKRGMISNKVSL